MPPFYAIKINPEHVHRGLLEQLLFVLGKDLTESVPEPDGLLNPSLGAKVHQGRSATTHERIVKCRPRFDAMAPIYE